MSANVDIIATRKCHYAIETNLAMSIKYLYQFSPYNWKLNKLVRLAEKFVQQIAESFSFRSGERRIAINKLTTDCERRKCPFINFYFFFRFELPNKCLRGTKLVAVNSNPTSFSSFKVWEFLSESAVYICQTQPLSNFCQLVFSCDN